MQDFIKDCPDTVHQACLLTLYGNIFFHGSSQKSTQEIWDTGLWVSNRPYPMIWMTNNFAIVMSDMFAYEPEEPGRILVLELDYELVEDLYMTGLLGCYYLKLGDSINTGNYYNVEGLEVIYMLDNEGNLLKSK